MPATKENIKKIVNIAQNIEGWLSVHEGAFLYKLATNLPDRANIVEIGSFKGKSTIFLGSGLQSKKRGRLYAIDPHRGSPEFPEEHKKIDTYQEFLGNVRTAGLAKIVIPIRKKSTEAAAINCPIGLLFIDGSHDYAAVKNDFLSLSKKIKKGGWIILHDATVLDGPWRVARQEILRSGNFRRVGMLGSMVFGQYWPRNNSLEKFFQILKNSAGYLFIISYVTMRKMPFPPILRKKISNFYFKKKFSRKNFFSWSKKSS